MIQTNIDSNCCGCHACVLACPVGCIRMEENQEGFLYPKIQYEKCISCNRCENVCPMLNQQHTNENHLSAYLFQNENQEIHQESTSGGFFSEIGKFVIQKGGVVFGASFNEDLEVVHRYVDVTEDLSLFRNSKYVQSNIKKSFLQAKKFLDQGRWVCFSGTPCQIQALSLFLGKDYEKLIMVDFICRGVPSPKLLRKYILEQEKKEKSPITELKFRSKKYGYHFGTIQLKFANGHIKNEGPTTNSYLRPFFQGCSSRMSCFHCPMKYINRISDFTLFDSWHAHDLSSEIIDDKGTTAVLAHTIKAKKIILYLRGTLIPVSTHKLVQFDGDMLLKQPRIHKNRKYFLQNLENITMDQLIKRYLPITKYEKMRRFAKPFFYKIGLHKLYQKMKKRI